jgi:hypothetical protein
MSNVPLVGIIFFADCAGSDLSNHPQFDRPIWR